MKFNWIFSKIIKFFLFFVLPILFLFVLVISYLALQRLVFPCDRILKNGEKISEFAKKVRKDLLKCKGLRSVVINTKDRLKLSGFFLKRKNAVANLLICHGYQSCKESVCDIFDMFDNFNILVFDFRAHGQSEGKFKTLGCHEYKDVLAAANFLRSETKSVDRFFKKLPLIILGISMGGSSSIKALEYEPNLCDVLILDSAFSNLVDVIYNAFTITSGLPRYPFVPILTRMVNFIAGCDINSMRPIDIVKNIKKPIFFMHSCLDDIVKPNDSLMMYAQTTNENNKIWIAHPCVHGKLRKNNRKIYKKKIEKFLKKILC
ncbi:alpha/beta hydrolase [Candidatus Babeliales bacterium]|nr:alpha/beta hydrolase [Candidatus Babeliales bacterium]